MLHNLLVILPLYSPIDIYLDNDRNNKWVNGKNTAQTLQHLSKSQVNSVEILREWGRYKGDSVANLCYPLYLLAC